MILGWRERLALLVLAMLRGVIPASADTRLPDGFAYLSDIDATIVQRMAYAGAENFTRAPVPGYDAAECVLAREVAEALHKVAADLAASHRVLIVHDCYRPARAVEHFVRWVRAGGSVRDPKYYPRVDRKDLIAEGYIASPSGHSSGGSIDLTFGTVGADGTVTPADMRGMFDLFDVISHTRSTAISPAAQQNRLVLVEAMTRRGFESYDPEWWHFRYTAQPFPGRSFDFPVLPKTGQPPG